MSKIKQYNFPISAHNRYAIDQATTQHSPLSSLLKDANNNTLLPTTIQKSPIHRSELFYIPKGVHTWSSFAPPHTKTQKMYEVFSPIFFYKAQQMEQRFAAYQEQQSSIANQEIKKLQDFFYTINLLRDIDIFIQSQIIGIQKG